MKPQARPFTVEIKRNKRPAHSSPSLTASSSLRPGDGSLRERPTRDTLPNDASREAAFEGALSEADRVFGRTMTPVPIATPVLHGIDPPQNADPQLRARADVTAAPRTHDAEGGGSEKPRQGRILPDFLSAAREEEQAREAPTISGARRVLRRPGTPALPETAQPEAVQPEEPVRSSRARNARAVVSQGEAVPPRPKVAAFVARAATGVDQAPVSAKPSGAGRGNGGGGLRRKGKREREVIPLRAGERWKRRLRPVCR